MVGSDMHSPRTVGRYVLYGELASGGMATVHFGRLAGPVGFSRTVAIKRLHPHFAKDPEFVSMFLDEARLCGRIRHPNVVSVLDVVSTEGEIFIVMEYVAGEALSRLLKSAWAKKIPTPPRIAATIITSVLHGLHAAHETKDEHGRPLGIVHRDVSPQNILVGGDGTARLLDFGVAKATGRMQTTRDGEVKGKIAYMPSEQLSGGTVTRQSDIYAAAVVFWEALCGRRLFDGETEAIVLVRAIEGRIESPSVHNPEISVAAAGVVLRGLAKDAANRFATAREMAVAIEQTFGLASPSEVGEWVETVAAEELSTRALRVSEIETASVAGVTPRIGFVQQRLPEVHSQVSSISVSRPAMELPKRRNAVPVLLALCALLAVVGVVVGMLAMSAFSGKASTAAPNLVEASKPRGIAIVSPRTFASKAASRPTTTAPAPPPPQPPPHRVSEPPPQPKKNCEPPYVLDPETGRKKYKLECL